MRVTQWIVVLVVAACLGCPGEAGPGDDPDGYAAPDGQPSGEAIPDQAIPDWPTQVPDSVPWADTYSGSPFGCQSDADCFGLVCCPTPWGVKLCAETCASP